MVDSRSWAGVAVAGFAIALALFVVASGMEPDSGGPELTEQEPKFPDVLGESDRPASVFDYTNCASMIGCLDGRPEDRERWMREQLEAAERREAVAEPASGCVGFCFNAIVESVDEESWRVARVVMIGKKGKRTPAIVERTSIRSSSRGPAAEGKPVRFACFDRVRGEEGLRFESCSQMVAGE